MSKTNIVDLPEDVLEKIFLYVENVEIKKITEVCKLFNSTVGSSIKLMDKISLTWNEKNLCNTDVLMSSNRKYRQIRILNGRELLSNKLLKFLTKQTFIHAVELSKCQYLASELEKLLEKMRVALQTLKILYSVPTNDKDLKEMRFPKLKNLEISLCERNDKLFIIFKKKRMLESFAFKGHSSHIIPFLLSRKAVQKLSLADCIFLMEDLGYVFKRLAENLVEINLKHVQLVDIKYASAIDFPKLKSLRLESAPLVKGRLLFRGPYPLGSFLNFFRQAKNLETLELNGCKEMASSIGLHRGFMTILLNSRKLQNLYICEHLFPLFQNAAIVENTEFELKELSLHVTSALKTTAAETHGRVLTFLRQHQATLTKLSLQNISINREMLSCLLDMKNLYSVNISLCPLLNNTYNYSKNFCIKKFRIEHGHDNTNNLLVLLPFICPNIQELALFGMNISQERSAAIAKLMRLKKIEFEACSIYPLKFGKATSIKFNIPDDGRVRYTKSMIGVIRENQQLQYLTVPDIVTSLPEYNSVMKKLKLHELNLDKNHIMKPGRFPEKFVRLDKLFMPTFWAFLVCIFIYYLVYTVVYLFSD